VHVHGPPVSPIRHGDNVFVSVLPGDSFDYDYQIRDDHPAVLFWYHPHYHHEVTTQVFRGLDGAIIIAQSSVLPRRRPMPASRGDPARRQP
jgi:FtsP/CotA-like multicopper oxidase with cupredoxin domain